jgi:hypothetical protein
MNEIVLQVHDILGAPTIVLYVIEDASLYLSALSVALNSTNYFYRNNFLLLKILALERTSKCPITQMT